MPSASLAWLLAQPNVASCIVGARTAEQVEANARLVQLSEVSSALCFYQFLEARNLIRKRLKN